jgi:UDP-2-acetamido-2,6-beta-L-arabino-hexul-4-ose reductase
MKVLVTGANGFIGKNLVLRLREDADIEVLTFVRGQSDTLLHSFLAQADAVVHLAGENRPSDVEAFYKINTGLTERLCQFLQTVDKRIPVLFASSIQVEQDNPYGSSKLAAERVVGQLAEMHGNPVAVYRLPGVFGKWCKPNYNSVVSTFCYNKAHDLPITINDANTKLRLVYIDDVVDALLAQLAAPWIGLVRPAVNPEYTIALGVLAEQIDAFKNCRDTLISEPVGTGLIRALYATYVSYLPKEKFVYKLQSHGDERGIFVEMLKTPNAGQFSFFTVQPGITRGEHYHHTKTEKFLVIKGHACFGFRNMITNEIYYVETHGNESQIVESVPGWTHDIKNIGDDVMIVMLWANEIFDPINPDTYSCPV